jgi:hypothetical protein
MIGAFSMGMRTLGFAMCAGLYALIAAHTQAFF